MPTYSKETALYDTGKIGTDITAAGQTASRYITAVDQNGIKVHAENNPTTNYTKIDANGMEVYQNVNSTATKVASFGSSGAQIGQSGAENVYITPNAIALRQGNIPVAYFSIPGDGYTWIREESTVKAPWSYSSNDTVATLEYPDRFTIKNVYQVVFSQYADTAPGLIISSSSNKPTFNISDPNTWFFYSLSGNTLTISANGTVSSSATSSGRLLIRGDVSVYGFLTQNYIGSYPAEDYESKLFSVGNGLSDSDRSSALSLDYEGNLTVGGHSSPIGSRLSAVWTASSNSATGAAMTGSITLTPGVWMLGMITPTCSTSKAYYFANLSSVLTYPYFNMGTGGSGWVPVKIESDTTTYIASGASASCTYSNLTRGRILAVRIA